MPRYLKRFQRMFGGYYQSVLRAELCARYGVAWGPIVNGQAELAGVDPALLEVFSKRTGQIDVARDAKVAEFRDRQGRDPNQWELAAITREAAVDTRGRKTGADPGQLRQRWGSEAAAVGWDAARLGEALTAASIERRSVEPSGLREADVLNELSMRGSAWARADVVRAVCDLARPLPDIDAGEWAARIEGFTDAIVDRLADLDPDTTPTRRASDGRSVWLEPTSPHLTTEAILVEEERILTWALDAHQSTPTPSRSVGVEGLDVMQADAARAVAGHDPLVLVVGPAGAGKTTMLRAAAEDLEAQGRPVFGVAPSAKAARVLEAETRMDADTLAKLLYEWHHPTRPPHPAYRLPAGTTIVVDEAGMVGTGDLAQLVALADTRRWRLVLAGDPHQLQAVGRGGMFAELCATGRTHPLTHIHRFANRWEATASVQLRHGDPAAIDTYAAQGRIHPGPIADHITAITEQWLHATSQGRSVAVTASSNEHVDTLNAAVQAARGDAGQLGGEAVSIAGGERAHVGDVVVTRRNVRDVTTSAGERVRNRERWTVTGLHPDGALTVTPLQGHGEVTLPAEYVAAHVRLGYAATEHGAQGDTVDIGVHLATDTTTRRNLYVGATRGRTANHLHITTMSDDPGEARDRFERILTTDRADVAATTVRRDLAADDRPRRRAPIPHWMGDARRQLTERKAVALEREAAAAARLDVLEQHVEIAHARLQAAERAVALVQPDVAATGDQLTRAERVVHRREFDVRRAPRHRRWSARRDLRHAEHARDAAATLHDQARTVAAPALAERDHAHHTLTDAQAAVDAAKHEAWFVPTRERSSTIQRAINGLDTWQRWADGHPVPATRVHTGLHHLAHQIPRHLLTTLLVPAQPEPPTPTHDINHGPLPSPSHGLDRGPDHGLSL